MVTIETTGISEALDVISQVSLVPTIVLLIALIVYAAYSVGSVLVEGVGERARYKVSLIDFIDSVAQERKENIEHTICESGFLATQKEALCKIWQQRFLPEDSHIALAERLTDELRMRRARTLSRNQTAAKVAPMLGLMGTLIPLGPGIVALGNGDTSALSSSLLIAFNTTVAGLIVAVVTFTIARVRKMWYVDYESAFSAAVTALLERSGAERESDYEDGNKESVASGTSASLAYKTKDARK